jgi:hypothetical protein
MPSLSRELISGVTILCSAGGRGEHAIRLLGLLLACWACCWPCGLAAGLVGLLASGPCWPSFFIFLCFSLVSFCFFPTLVLLPSFSSCSFYVQIFICTLKHNIKFRLNKINIMHIK